MSRSTSISAWRRVARNLKHIALDLRIYFECRVCHHLPSFRAPLERLPPRVRAGGITRGASVHQFTASIAIAGVSMRLPPGGMRELHWHANAAEWGYVGMAAAALPSCTRMAPRPLSRSGRAMSGSSRAAGGIRSKALTRRLPFHPDLRQRRFFRRSHVQLRILAVTHSARLGGAILGLSQAEAYFAADPVQESLRLMPQRGWRPA